jgi:sarcosine oxidase subunit gamma
VLRVDPQAAIAAASPAGAENAATSFPLGASACRASVSAEWAALWLGPDEQLLIGPADLGPAFAARVSSLLHDVTHSLVDVSHRQGAIKVTGVHAAALLNASIPLDLSPAQFPVDACTRTVFAKAEVVLWRRATDWYHLEVWRSFMPYVAGLLAQAEQEFGAPAGAAHS